MKAMIFAAGLGTRLRPLTDNRPKALVEAEGKTLLQHCIEKLQTAGVREIIVNVHHFADMVEDFLQANNNFGLRIELSDEREMLLDTGGGLKRAAWFFDDGQSFILHNVDILSNIDLADLCAQHRQSNALVTLACNIRESSRYFLFDASQRLCGWENTNTGEQKIVVAQYEPLQRMAFGGIHVITPAIFDSAPAADKFSIIDWYLQLAPQVLIQGYTAPDLQIVDMGKAANYTNGCF